MPLFVAHHQHLPGTCPASAELGSPLLAHVSAANAARYGVAIQAEALLDDSHALILILEAADQGQVDVFMEFFAGLGSVQIFPASCCEVAVARGGCPRAEARRNASGT